jgi:hypothetical protein
MYELYIEGFKVDIDQKISVQLSFAIDDVANFSSRETGFSKTIVLPGTGRNNQIFGYIYDLASFNYEQPGAANIGAFFNVAQTSRAELRLNGLLVLKGVFRITNIVKDKDIIEYEGAIFGELAGFVAEIGTNKLEDLDFSVYNHNYTRDNIVNSWDNKVIDTVTAGFFTISGKNYITFAGTKDYGLQNVNQIIITDSVIPANNKTYTILFYGVDGVNGYSILQVQESVTFSSSDDITIQFTRPSGTGYYYPLIDYGTYSTPQTNPGRVKRDYDYRTFRPALFVKEYIDKMFEPSGYTYESSFFDSAFFKKLIVPNNTKELKSLFTDLLDVSSSRYSLIYQLPEREDILSFNNENLKRNITGNGNPNYTYTGPNAKLKFQFNITGRIRKGAGSFFFVRLYRNSTLIKEYNPNTFNFILNLTDIIEFDIQTNDTFHFTIFYKNLIDSYLDFNYLRVNSTNPILTDSVLGSDILIKYSIPRNILQKDFFIWIMKMFNLYITEDKIKEKHLLIEPYVDYYDLSESIDWTYKVARNKPWNIKPMGMLNGRFFEYKYKEDNDFYNEGYKKKYNLPYGSRLEDTAFQFAKDKQTIEIGFSPSVLIQYQNTDKVLTAIYKKSSGNAVDQEERMDSNIRIMMAKKMTGVTSWFIRNNDAAPASANLGAALTAYGYAGHFDDPVNPTKDINFGAAEEIYFDPNSYTSNNLFNDYWSEYISEIADKDSKILSCYVHLTPLDIAQLDFSKAILIDGIRFRLNKIEDYDYTNNELVKVELLKIINNG